MYYAIIEAGGKQIKVEEGSVIYVEKLDAEVDSEVVFDKSWYYFQAKQQELELLM